ncbi:MAG: acylphosphatase [Microvirga sp.]
MTQTTGDEVAHVVVHGQVQAVGFRAWVHHQAELRGLDGWVRNRRDGSVEALFRGDAQVVTAMIEVCRKGPAIARVESVERVDGAGPDDDAARPAGFRVLGTV